MTPKRHSLLAAFMVAATLVAPTTALAAGGDKPVTMPAPAPESKQEQTLPLAQVKVTREEALAIAKKAFTIPADMGEPNVNISQSKAYASWDINWRTPAKQPNPRSINVTVNAITGQIMGYWSSTSAQTDAPLTYSRNEAFKVAKATLDKLFPNQQENLRYVDNPLQYGFYGGNASFQFHWARLEQGYPVGGDGVDITIDARTGNLVTYNMSWRSDLTVELPKSILEQAKAEDAYRQQMPMQLMYRYYQKPLTDSGDWKLVYKPVSSFPVVSQDGKLVDYTGQAIDFDRLSSLKLVPASTAGYQKPEKALTHEEALALAQAAGGKKDMPTDINCQEYGEETKTTSCNFSWYTPDDKGQGGSSVGVSIDLNTGLVMNYNAWGPYQPMDQSTKPKYTEDQAKAIAIAFMQKYRPDLAGKVLIAPQPDYEYKMKLAGEPIRYYHFQFLMTHELIPLFGQEASIEIDSMTGVIRYFYANSVQENQKQPFPELKDLIKADAAVESFLKNQGLELTWITYMPMTDAQSQKPDAKPVTALVWAPKQVMGIDMIDATTGVPYDWNGRDLIEAAKRPMDVDGHFAQREIELLWARGVFELKDGKFFPEATATAGEFARWLVLARGMQPYPMYDFAMNFAGKGATATNLSAAQEAPYFGAALQAGILMPEDFTNDAQPGAPVSRELAALWVARALGYGDIAKMENRIEMPYTDKAQVGAKYANAVALMSGLKIVPGEAFKPQGNITRGEAAQMLFVVASKTRFYGMY